MLTPIRMRGIRRAVFGSALTVGDVLLILLLIYAAIGNCFELRLHSCRILQPDPVCGSIFWLVVDFVIGAVGVAVTVTRVYPQSIDASHSLDRRSLPLQVAENRKVVIQVESGGCMSRSR